MSGSTVFEQTDDYIVNNYIKAAACSTFGAKPSVCKTSYFDLAYYCYKLDSNFKITSDQPEVNATFIKAFFERALEMQQLNIINDAQFKDIKSRLNRIAIEHELDCRIVRKNKHAAAKIQETEAEIKQLEAEKKAAIKELYSSGKKLKQIQEVQNKIKVLRFKIDQAHYESLELKEQADEDKKNPYSFVETFDENNQAHKALQAHEALKVKNRKIKAIISKVAWFVAIVVGIGEALVAGALGSVAMIAPAFFVNTALMLNPAKSVMKSIFVNNRADKVNGCGIKVDSTLFFSFVSASCFGLLSFSSCLKVLGRFAGIAGGMAIGATPAGVVAASIFLAAVSTIAITCLFDRGARSFKAGIKGKVKNYFKNTFTNIFAYDCIADGGAEWADWNELSKTQKTAFYTKKAVNVAMSALALVAVIPVAFIFSVASPAMFMNKAQGLFLTAFKAGEIASKVASGIVVALGTPLNYMFQWQSVVTCCNLATKTIGAVLMTPVALLAAIVQPKKTWNHFKQVFKESFAKRNRGNLFSKCLSFVSRAVLTVCAVFNGQAQGLGFKNSTSIGATTAATGGTLNHSTTVIGGETALFAASTGANQQAVLATTEAATPASNFPASQLKAKMEELEARYDANKTDDENKAAIGTTFFNILKKNGGTLTDNQRSLLLKSNAFAFRNEQPAEDATAQATPRAAAAA